MKLEKFKFIFFFIPYHHIGGAERVHLNIIKALPHKPIVFFDYSNSDLISQEFRDNAYCFLVTNEKRKKYAYRFLWVIASVFPVTVFGCNSGLFFNFVSRLKKKVIAIDLTHAFSFPEIGMEIVSLPYVDLLDKRVVINTKTYEDYKKLYAEKNISQALLERFEIIPNGININSFDRCCVDNRFENFTIGYVGRNSSEKRPELFFEIIKRLKINAKVIGDNFNNYKKDFPQVIYFENCNVQELIRKEFSSVSLLIVSSRREGFPLVIMEAMELGIPVISTDVGSVYEHIIDNVNGFLAPIKEADFLDFTIQKISELMDDSKLYANMSLNARKHAVENFSIEKFNTKYRELFYD